MRGILFFVILAGMQWAQAADFLVQLHPNARTNKYRVFSHLPMGTDVEDLNFNGWVRLQIPESMAKSFSVKRILSMPGVMAAQPNFRMQLPHQPGMEAIRQQLQEKYAGQGCDFFNMCGLVAEKDNPDFPAEQEPGSGNDPLLGYQWGILDIGASHGWRKSIGNPNVVVAVIDTGVDYTHEDLRDNLWRNPGEMGTDAQGRDKSSNGVDDDGNGYVDDVVGWDFVSNDNKPYDLKVGVWELITKGGNPGHGTHCAGNIAARGFNGRGISGVAPHVSIMVLRFLSEKGQGTTADAIKSILYAVNNGAHITSNSWGSQGEDKAGGENEALKDAIRYAQSRGSLFIAAAGNGRQNSPMSPAEGYDNDTDKLPVYPASYDMDVIISVAALDRNDQLGTFSNFGARTVDLGAPGVAVYSTTVGSRYSDAVLDFLGMRITWDGTSMATPHVAGAAALYLSQHPRATWSEIKDALLNSTVPVAALQGKTVTGGKLNVDRLMNQ